MKVDNHASKTAVIYYVQKLLLCAPYITRAECLSTERPTSVFKSLTEPAHPATLCVCECVSDNVLAKLISKHWQWRAVAHIFALSQNNSALKTKYMQQALVNATAPREWKPTKKLKVSALKWFHNHRDINQQSGDVLINLLGKLQLRTLRWLNDSALNSRAEKKKPTLWFIACCFFWLTILYCSEKKKYDDINLKQNCGKIEHFLWAISVYSCSHFRSLRSRYFAYCKLGHLAEPPQYLSPVP